VRILNWCNAGFIIYKLCKLPWTILVVSIKLIPQLCVTGCGQNETIDHLIIHCLIFGVLWQQIKTWIGVFFVDPQHVIDHYYQFAYSSGSYALRRSFLYLIWLCGIWVLWNERNQRLFANTTKTTVQLLEKVKIIYLKWFKVKNVCFSFGYHMWWQRPLVCLGIGWSNVFLVLVCCFVRNSFVILFCFFWHSLC